MTKAFILLKRQIRELRMYEMFSILLILPMFQSCQPANKEVIQAENDLPLQIEEQSKDMRINLEKVSFEIPEAFDSEKSTYHFASPETYKDKDNIYLPEEDLSVGIGSGIDFRSIAAFQKENREEIEEKNAKARLLGKLAYGKDIDFLEKIVDDRQLVISGYPTWLSVVAVNHGESRRSPTVDYASYLTIYDSQTTAMSVNYKTHTHSEKLTNKLIRIGQSLRRLEKGSETARAVKTNDGFIRRYAGGVTLEVPQEWLPTRNFEYRRELPKKDDYIYDRRIVIKLYDPDNQAALPLENAEIEKPSAGERRDLKTELLETKYFEGTVQKYLIVKNSQMEEINPPMPHLVEKTVFRWGKLKAEDGTTIVFTAEAPQDEEKSLDDLLTKWLNTFQPQGANK